MKSLFIRAGVIFKTKPQSIYSQDGGLTTATHYGFFRPHPQSLTNVRKTLFNSERNGVSLKSPGGNFLIFGNRHVRPQGFEVLRYGFWAILAWKGEKILTILIWNRVCFSLWFGIGYFVYKDSSIFLLLECETRGVKQCNPSQMVIQMKPFLVTTSLSALY